MIFETTPSQTVGPYFAIGLPWAEGPYAVAPEGTPGAITIRGTVYDGAGEPIPDYLIETWQADPEGRFADTARLRRPVRRSTGFRGFARFGVEDGDGTLRDPDRQARAGLRPRAARLQAPHIDVSVFARGMLHRVRDADLLRRRGRGQRRPIRCCATRAGRAARRRCSRSRRRTATASTSASRAPARRSSLTSEPSSFAGIYARGEVAPAVRSRAGCGRCSTCEVALAGALASEGLIPQDAREAIAAACADACARGRDLVAAAATAAASPRSPVVGLVRPRAASASRLRRVRPPRRDKPGHPRHGGDARRRARADAPSSPTVRGAAVAAAALADAHRAHADGRADAAPAGVADDVRAARRGLARTDSTRLGSRLDAVARRRLAVQMGGPVGSRSPAIAARVAAQLGLAEPIVPWQTIRVAPAGSRRARNAGGRPREDRARRDAVREQEVGEVHERARRRPRRLVGDGAQAQPGRGDFRARVHDARARPGGDAARVRWSRSTSARRARGRRSGARLRELLGLVGLGCRLVRAKLLESLEVDADRMQENLERLADAGVRRGPRSATATLDGDRRADRSRARSATAMSAVELHHASRPPATEPALVLGGSLGTTLAMWEPQLLEALRADPPPRHPLRPPRSRSLAGAAGSVRDRRSRARRAGAARSARDRATRRTAVLSIGGMVGLWLAINAPERIKTALILICRPPTCRRRRRWTRAGRDGARCRHARGRRRRRRRGAGSRRRSRPPDPAAGRALPRDDRDDADRGLRGLLRGDRDARSAGRTARRHVADARDRGRAGPLDPARPRARDRGRGARRTL